MKHQSERHSEILLRNQETKQRTKINFVESMTWIYWFAKHHKALTHNDWLFVFLLLCFWYIHNSLWVCGDCSHNFLRKGPSLKATFRDDHVSISNWLGLHVSTWLWTFHLLWGYGLHLELLILAEQAMYKSLTIMSAVFLRGQMMASDLLELGLNGVVNWRTCLPETKVIFSWRTTIILYYLAIPLAPIS